MARLKEGYTEADYRKVIDHKWKQWGSDDRMRQYVNPETLSRKSHFCKYLGECDEKPVQNLPVVTEPEQREVVQAADPERIKEALKKGWEILHGGKKRGVV